MQQAVFAAFFLVEHELHCDARPARPAWVRRLAAVADQITRIGGCAVVKLGRGDKAVGFAASQ